MWSKNRKKEGWTDEKQSRINWEIEHVRIRAKRYLRRLWNKSFFIFTWDGGDVKMRGRIWNGKITTHCKSAFVWLIIAAMTRTIIIIILVLLLGASIDLKFSWHGRKKKFMSITNFVFCATFISASHQTDFIMINLKPLKNLCKPLQKSYSPQFSTIILHVTSFY